MLIKMNLAYFSDEELVADYLKGDEAALEILVKRYLPAIYGFSRRYVGDREKAADIAQETFVKVWRNLKKFDTNRAFKPWIFAIAKNTALDWLKRREDVPFSSFDIEETKEIDSLGADFSFPKGLADSIDRKRFVEKTKIALQKLPKNYHAVFEMRNQDQLTFKEIAAILKEPLNTVKSRYRRAVQAIRRQLSEQALLE